MEGFSTLLRPDPHAVLHGRAPSAPPPEVLCTVGGARRNLHPSPVPVHPTRPFALAAVIPMLDC